MAAMWGRVVEETTEVMTQEGGVETDRTSLGHQSTGIVQGGSAGFAQTVGQPFGHQSARDDHGNSLMEAE